MIRLLPLLVLGSCAAFVGGCTSSNSSASLGAANLIKPQGSPNFRSPEANFAIYFPVSPQKRQVSNSIEGANFKTFFFASRTSVVHYLVVATTIPAEADASNPTTFLNGLQKGFLKGSKAKLEKSREVSLDGVPGRELNLSAQNGAALSRVYLYFTPKISYQVMAIAPKDNFQRQRVQIDKVLGSFRLLSKS